MCGFAGVICRDETYRVKRETLEKMSRAIAHRGPDGEGFFLTREHEPITPDAPQVAMAFRRLAILDPDPRSNQPFTIGRLTMVFNGEMYNFKDLRAEISSLRPDYAWRTTGDTEVLLMSYDVWREKCVEKLNGMFAIAIWDAADQSLFLARDRMGQKPLYVSSDGEDRVVAFASEIEALHAPAFPWHKPRKFFVADYLRHGYLAAATASAGIFQLRPSERKLLFAEPKEDPIYFNRMAASPSSAAPRGAAPVDQTRRLVMQAVQRQLVSDVSLGVFLSGGIDSSVIARCARESGAVKTFSIAFDDPRYDESSYARQVAKHLDTEHHEFRVTPDVVADLPRLAAVFGDPFADSSAIPTHYLARETRRLVKVALSGDGGDELFGGYDRYRAMKLSSRLSHTPGFARRIAASVARPFSEGHPRSTLTRAARLLGSIDLDPADRYDQYMRLFDDATIAALLSPDDVTHDSAIATTFESALALTHDPIRAAMMTDRLTYLPGDLLTKVDRCSMLHALEVRSPFMDHDLVQFAAGLTTDQLLKGGGKRMLREAFSHELPDFVFKRRKMGFAVPIGEWFRGQLRSMLRDNLFAAGSFARTHFNLKLVERLVDEHESSRADHSQRLYALLMLELWWAQWRTAPM